jgi:hypothetical protein
MSELKDLLQRCITYDYWKPQSVRAASELSALEQENETLKARLAEAEEALELIGDLAFDRDGYTGNAEKLGELIDELYGYAKDPKKAYLVNHPEVKP